MSRGPRRRAAAVLFAVAALVPIAACSTNNSAMTTGNNGGGAGSAFALTTDAAAAIKAAGLPAMATEGSVVHYHAHLDVIINGAAVTVPASIGIDSANRAISPLHTHTPDGVVHIEAEQDANFTVGQLLTEWGVKLDKTCIATYCTDDKSQLLAFKNGKADVDPPAITIKAHDEIVLWYGPKGGTPSVPSSYEFKGGL